MSGQPEEGSGERQRGPRPVFLRKWFQILLVGALCLIVGFALASNKVPPAPSAQPTPTPTPPRLPGPSPATTLPDSLDGTGSYLVGDHVRPGMYRSGPNSAQSGCHWSRSTPTVPRSFTHPRSDAPVGMGWVLLLSGDYFDTSDCARWVFQPGANPPATISPVRR
jgi:hypothetical protein